MSAAMGALTFIVRVNACPNIFASLPRMALHASSLALAKSTTTVLVMFFTLSGSYPCGRDRTGINHNTLSNQLQMPSMSSKTTSIMNVKKAAIIWKQSENLVVLFQRLKANTFHQS